MTGFAILMLVLTLASVAAWAHTENVGWSLPTAVFGYLLIRQFVDVWGWVSLLFWMLVLVAVVVLLFAARWFGAMALTIFAIMVAIAVIGGTARVAHIATLSSPRSTTTPAPGDPAVLTVEPSDIPPAAARCTNGDTFSDNSLKPVGSGRQWSDSLSTPVGAQEKGAQLTEILSEVCVNPILGDAYAQALSEIKIGDFSVADANPWLGQFLAKSTSDSQLRSWMTLKHLDGDETKIVTDSAGNRVVFVTTEYLRYAEMINSLLVQFDNQGVKEGYTSTAHWPLGSLVANNLPRAHKVTDPNAQEDKQILALTFTTKAGDECPTVFGVNTGDKRPEFVSCEQAKVIAPSTPTVPRTCEELGTCGSSGTNVSPPPGTPPGSPSSSTTPEPTPTPSCMEKECQPAPTPAPGRSPAASPASAQENSPPAPPASPATTATPVIPASGATAAPTSTESTPIAEPSGMATGGVNPDGE